jgi:hypothetical protein
LRGEKTLQGLPEEAAQVVRLVLGEIQRSG